MNEYRSSRQVRVPLPTQAHHVIEMPESEEGRRMGAKWALCTVSPDNPNSLNNTLRAGFEIVEEKEMYGGIRRYVLRKALV